MRRSVLLAAPAILAVVLLAGCSSGGIGVAPENPQPIITTLDPEYAVTGGTSVLTLDVHGQGFGQNSVVRWNGEDQTTSLLSSPPELILRATIPSDEVNTPGTALVTVFNPPPGGGGSNIVKFGIHDPGELHPNPTVSTVMPNSIDANEEVTLTVHGTGFVALTEVIWKEAMTGTSHTETHMFVSDTQLTVVIPAAHVGPSGNATLQVKNPAPGGGTDEIQVFVL